MIWWMIYAVVAYFLKGLCGFGSTLVFTTMLSFSNNNINISPVELILGYPTNIILTWKERKSIKWNICLPSILLVILGSIPGVLFLKNVDSRIIKIVFGAVIIFVGLEMLLREISSRKSGGSPLFLGIIGLLSGLLCGLYGIGALMGAYIGRVTDDTSSFKANMCCVFLIENTFRLLMYFLTDILSAEIFRQALMLLPFMFIGVGLGIFSGKVLNEKLVKRLIVIMLIISGASLIINSL
jgi:uncharacterized membrane protein YfcA